MEEIPLRVKYLTRAICGVIIAFAVCGIDPPYDPRLETSSPFWLPWKLVAIAIFIYAVIQWGKMKDAD